MDLQEVELLQERKVERAISLHFSVTGYIGCMDDEKWRIRNGV